MRTRLTRIGSDLAVRLEKPLPEELGLEENSEVLSPNDQRFRESAEKVASKHAGLFRRLAK
jgi:antitoxin component of MazEF toxin-antitoxin module